jgi:HD-GYP domain-containing protein (c-di-GMP phosphodiesterase class II)
MALFSLPDADDNDFFLEAYDEFLEQYNSCESSIVDLEHQPKNSVLLNDLFRTIHTVKANIGLVGFEPMVEMLQDLETLLDFVRKETLPFSSLVGDLVLLLMDQAKDFIEQFKANNKVEYNKELFSQIELGLKEIAVGDLTDPSVILIDLIALMDQQAGDQHKAGRNWLEDLSPNNEELAFLYSLAKSSEKRVVYWKGRTDRIGPLAIAMNKAADNPVDPIELAASLFIHDISMAFLPGSLLNQNKPLNQKQQSLVRQHVPISTQLMRSIFNSHLAGQDLSQHQELVNGKGYPNALTSSEIGPGAKIIAIVHTFEAITHGHSSITLRKRPLMRALLEINKKAGIDFSEYWVEIFMKVVTKHY